MTRARLAITVAALAAVAAPAAAWSKGTAKTKTKTEAKAPTDADATLAAVQRYYDEVTKLKADFRQDYERAVFGKKSTSQGKVYLSKPGKMRWDYAKPEETYFISDGTTLWYYDVAAKQAYKQSLQNTILPVAVTFLTGQGKLSSEFTAALDPGAYGGKGDTVLKLTPKKPSVQYKNLWLVLDPEDLHVKESIVLDASNNVNHFTFTNIKPGDQAKVEDKDFTFTAPKGVKVITPP